MGRFSTRYVMVPRGNGVYGRSSTWGALLPPFLPVVLFFSFVVYRGYRIVMKGVGGRVM